MVLSIIYLNEVGNGQINGKIFDYATSNLKNSTLKTFIDGNILLMVTINHEKEPYIGFFYTVVNVLIFLI